MNKLAVHTHVNFQNTFPFVSTFRQTDDIRKKRKKKFVEQGISVFPLYHCPWNKSL